MKNPARVARDPVSLRLDALLRLIVEASKENARLTDASACRIFNSAGLTPTEIARIFGKKSATDIAPYLYSKKSSK